MTPSDLRYEMEAHLKSGDLNAYVEAEAAREAELVQQAVEHLRHGQFGEAADCWDEVAKLNRDLADVIKLALETQTEDDVFDAEDLAQADFWALFAAGFAQLWRGQHLTINRNTEAAIKSFEGSRAAFLQAGEYEAARGACIVYADYVAALTGHSAGIERMLRYDFDSAATLFMRARVALETLRDDTLPKEIAKYPDDPFLEGIESGVRTDAFALAGEQEKASFWGRILAGEYGGAVEHTRNRCELLQGSLDAMPQDAPNWMNYVTQSELASARADMERATALVLREQEQWDEAHAAYERARNELSAAATLVLRTGLPQAPALQESLMAMAVVTLAPEARQARKEQKLSERIKELQSERDDFIERISSAGTTVNNIVEAKAVAEQNTQIAVNVTNTVKTLLPELRAAIDGLQLPEGDELKKEIDALEASDEQPAQFLERAKTLTGRVADIVKNIGDAAKPVIPVIQKLAPLVGLVLAL